MDSNKVLIKYLKLDNLYKKYKASKDKITGENFLLCQDCYNKHDILNIRDIIHPDATTNSSLFVSVPQDYKSLGLVLGCCVCAKPITVSHGLFNSLILSDDEIKLLIKKDRDFKDSLILCYLLKNMHKDRVLNLFKDYLPDFPFALAYD